MVHVEPPPPPDPMVFPFTRPPRRAPRRTALVWLIGLAVGILLGREIGQLFMPEWIGAIVGGIVGLLIVARRQRQRADERPLGRIVFDGPNVELPRDAFSPKTDRIAVREILSIEEVGRKYGSLLLRVKSRMYGYPFAVLGGPAGARRVREELVRRLAAEPDGEALLAALEQREDTADRLFAQQPHATRALLLVIAVVYGIAASLGAYGDQLDGAVVLLRMGASVPAYVHDGAWYRLLTANLLHGGAVHIGFNGLAILGLGYIVERLMGTPRFLVLYLMSGVTGTILSAFFSDAVMSVGASTSVFGLFLAWGYFSLRYNARLPAGFAVTNFQWGVLVLNFALPLLIPFIDGWGHAGGAIGGVVIAAIMYPTASSFERPWGTRSAWWAAAGVLIAVHVAAVWMVYANDRREQLDRSDFVQLIAQREQTDPATLNNFAWAIAIDPDTTPKQLEVAEQLIERALAEVDEEAAKSAFLDTAATVAYRGGRARDAVELELAAIAATKADDADAMDRIARQVAALQGEEVQQTYHTQLLRFLEAADGYGLEPTDTATVAALKQGVRVEVSRAGTWYFGVDDPNGRRGILVVETSSEGPTKIPVVTRLPSRSKFAPLGFVDEADAERGVYYERAAHVDALPPPLAF
ncbi:MAG: rhomboid family intramembrane serine protease [Deltaproteobacteria bacterium]